MLNDEQKYVTQRAIGTFGILCQETKAMEELGELQAALGRVINKDLFENNWNEKLVDNVLEEMADVYIMLEQLMRIFNGEGKKTLKEHINFKIDRLKKTLDNINNK